MKQTPDTIMVNVVKYDLQTIRAIGKALDHEEVTRGSAANTENETYPKHNKYAEHTSMLDTPEAWLFSL